MAVSGDMNTNSEVDSETKTPSIRFDANIYVSSGGQVSKDKTDSCVHFVCGVVEVVNGSVDQVLHLMGHPYYELNGLVDNDGCLNTTPEVNDRFEGSLPRPPASHLVLQDNRLFRVVIDGNNDCRVVGAISQVVPSGDANVLKCGRDGIWTTIRSKDIDINSMVANGVVFAVVSEGGFAFIQTDVCPPQEMSELTLVVNKGYIVLEETALHWTRLRVGLRRDEFATNTTKLLAEECVVTGRGGYLRRDDHFEVFGSHNAVVYFKALKNMMEVMATVGVQRSDDMTGEEGKPSDDEVIDGQRYTPEVVSESLESLDLLDDFDDCTPDSFS